MASNDEVVNVVIQVRDQLSTGLGGITSALNNLRTTSTNAGGSLGSLSNTMGGLGGTLGALGLKLAPTGTALSALGPYGTIANIALTAFNGTVSKAVGIVNEFTDVLVSSISQAIAYAEQIERISGMLSLNIETTQEYIAAAWTANVSVGELSQIFRTMQIRVQSAIDGNEDAIKTFRRLGIEISELKNLSNDQDKLFMRLVEGLNSISDSTLKAATGTEAFGRSYNRAAPFIGQGNEYLARMKTLMRDVGAVASEETIHALDNLGDKVMVVSGIFNVFKTNLAELLIRDRLFEKLTLAALDTISGLRPLIELVIYGSVIFLKFASDLAGPVVHAFSDVIKIVSSTAGGISGLFEMISATSGAGRGVYSAIFGEQPDIAEGYGKIKKSFDDINQSSQKLGQDIGIITNAFVDDFRRISESINKIKPDLDKLLDKFDSPETRKKIEELFKLIDDANKGMASSVKVTTETLAELSKEEKDRLSEVTKHLAKIKMAYQDAMDAGPTLLGNMKFELEMAEYDLKQLTKEMEELGPSDEMLDRYSKLKETIADLKPKIKELTDEEEKLINKQKELNKKLAEMSPSVGFEKALEELTSRFITFKDVFINVFQTMQNSFSSAIEGMVLEGKSFSDAMKGFFDSIKRTFIKMMADMVSQQLFRALFGLPTGAGPSGGGGGFLGAAFGAAAGAFGGGGASAPNAAQMSATAAAGTGLGGLGGLAGIGAAGAGGAAGGGVNWAALGIGAGVTGLAATYSAGSSGELSKTEGAVSGAISGAVTGAAIGSIIPGIGTLIGAGIGAIAGGAMGYFSSSKGKSDAAKAKGEQEQALVDAQEEIERHRKEAEQLIITATRTKLGGGLADPTAAAMVGNLFSGGISAEEVEQFGGIQNIMAQKAAIEALAGNQLTVNAPINITVGSLSSSYDVKILAEDLGFYLGSALSGALGGG